jgi:drug/metabolite transporter (DMT)-like permease
MMLVVAVLWSITSNVDKVGVQNSSPLFWLLSLSTVIALEMIPAVLLTTPKPLWHVRQHWPMLLSIGMTNAIGVSCQFTALTLTLVAHVIAIKRTSTVIAVFFGFWLFKESGLFYRTLGAGIMVLGVAFMLWDR